MADMERRVDTLIRKHMQVDIPADVEAQMAVQLAQFRAASGKEHMPRHERRLGRFAFVGALAAASLALVLFWPKFGDGSPYSAAAAQLRQAQSLQYTFELAPGTSIEFSYLEPKFFRARMSWGMEVRSDGSGRKLVLLHTTHKYAFEKAAPSEFSDQMNLVTVLKRLPAKASGIIGKRKAGLRTLVGYRIAGSAVVGASNLKELDLWIDAKTRSPDYAVFVFQVPGKPLYKMYIRGIRANTTLDRAMFSMTPPAGYTVLPGQKGMGSGP